MRETSDGVDAPVGGLRMMASAVIVVISVAGFLLMLLTDDLSASGTSLDELSTSGDFLQQSPEVAARDIDRLSYQEGDSTVAIPNFGVVPIGDDLSMIASVSPFPPTSFDLDVVVSLETAQGEPVRGASIDAIWDMTVMQHGPFETRFDHIGDGTYGAFFDLFMVGPWKLDLMIELPDRGIRANRSLIIYVWPE